MNVEIKITGVSQSVADSMENAVWNAIHSLQKEVDKEIAREGCPHTDIHYCGEDSICSQCGAGILDLFEEVNAERLRKVKP